MKNSFVLYTEQKAIFDKLSDDQAGKLIKAIYNYVEKGKLNEDIDEITNIIITPFITILDKDMEKYEETKKKRAEAGAKGGKQKVANAKQKKANLANAKIGKQKVANQAVYDNEYEYVNVNDNKLNNFNLLDNNIKSDKVELDTTNQYEIHKKIIEYLNKKTSCKYKSNTKTTQSKINARLNEGFKLDDFIVVINKKCKEWLGTEMAKYLRPETLFGTKFESYLNQEIVENNKNSEEDSSKDNDIEEWLNG